MIGMYDCSVDVLSTLCHHFVKSPAKMIETFKHLNESASHEMRLLNFNSTEIASNMYYASSERVLKCFVWRFD